MQCILIVLAVYVISGIDGKAIQDELPGGTIVHNYHSGRYVFQCNVIQAEPAPEKDVPEGPIYEPIHGERSNNSIRLDSTSDPELKADVKSILSIVQKVLENEQREKELEIEILKRKIEELTEDKKRLLDSIGDSSKCIDSFTMIEGRCILIHHNESHLSWTEGREYCQSLGADLIVFQDANDFAKIALELHNIYNDTKGIRKWIGASDEEVEGEWMWIDGRPMQLGPPFWGTRDNYVLQPNGGIAQNCAMLFSNNHFYAHDTECDPRTATTPICEYYL